MSKAVSPSANRRYGLARVCRSWRVPRATVYWRRREPSWPAARPGPEGAADDDALTEEIRDVIAKSPFYSEGYRKVWARLRQRGVRTAPRRVCRLMREHRLQAPDRPPPAPAKHHDGTITTDTVDTIWGTDMTETVLTTGQKVRLFAVVDHANSECIAVHAATSGNRWEALEPVRQGLNRHFGPAGRNRADGLKLRHDHGSNYMAADFQREIAFQGVTASPSYVREPEGNGVAERFFRTLKEQFLWVRDFDSLEALQTGLEDFRRSYNANWLNQRHGHRTPNQVRADQTAPTMAEPPLAMAA